MLFICLPFALMVKPPQQIKAISRKNIL